MISEDISVDTLDEPIRRRLRNLWNWALYNMFHSMEHPVYVKMPYAVIMKLEESERSHPLPPPGLTWRRRNAMTFYKREVAIRDLEDINRMMVRYSAPCWIEYSAPIDEITPDYAAWLLSSGGYTIASLPKVEEYEDVYMFDDDEFTYTSDRVKIHVKRLYRTTFYEERPRGRDRDIMMRIADHHEVWESVARLEAVAMSRRDEQYRVADVGVLEALSDEGYHLERMDEIERLGLSRERVIDINNLLDQRDWFDEHQGYPMENDWLQIFRKEDSVTFAF